jgi:hypothetical protein
VGINEKCDLKNTYKFDSRYVRSSEVELV